MIIKISKPSLFVSSKNLRFISDENGWGRCPLKAWLKVREIPVVCSAVMTSMDKLAPVAGTKRMSLEALEELLIRYVSRGEECRAIECEDCILIHPKIVGEGLWEEVVSLK